MMMKLLKRIFGHRHDWETTSFDKWKMPIEQRCRCGAKRELVRGNGLDEFYWQYEDGRLEECEDVF